MSRRGRDFMDERDYVDVKVREREQDRARDRDPLARYFQEDRRSEPGAMVLRQRDVETVERPRPRPRSPSPEHYREVSYARSVSPMPPPREREVDRVEIRERERERDRDRDRERERERQYREPSRERVVTRVVERERERERSPTPSPDRDRIRIVERSRVVSPSPSPSPPPPAPAPAPRQVIRGPVVEREVITHYTDVDHGVVYAPQPPPPPPQQSRERDTEIDIYSSRRHTEVDIHESTSRERRRSQSRSRVRLPPARASDKEIIVRSDRNRLEIDVDDLRNRRSRSAQPAPVDRRPDPVAEESRYIESRIDQRGEIGEAYHGATKDWTIIDVPPGTERVRMDGVGGGSADVTWQRYNGVRRTRFIPDRDDDAPRQKSRQVNSDRERGSRDHINVQIIDQGRSRDHDIEVETDRRMVKLPPPSPRDYVPAGRNDMWTEITKDLVSREAMDQLGYDYNETEYFYYILEYLRYEDVQELVQLSDRIRKNRRKHQHRQSRDDVDIDVDVVHRRHRSQSQHPSRREDDRFYEREVVVDRHLHPTYYR